MDTFSHEHYQKANWILCITRTREKTYFVIKVDLQCYEIRCRHAAYLWKLVKVIWLSWSCFHWWCSWPSSSICSRLGQTSLVKKMMKMKLLTLKSPALNMLKLISIYVVQQPWEIFLEMDFSNLENSLEIRVIFFCVFMYNSISEKIFGTWPGYYFCSYNIVLPAAITIIPKITNVKRKWHMHLFWFGMKAKMYWFLVNT